MKPADIVARLRSKYLGQLPIALEAAEEIERLRELYLQAVDDITEGLEWLKVQQQEIEDLRAELKEFSNQYQQLKRELEECPSGVTWIVRPPND
jgi:uncharacterized coiled-coil DUF342 family protein